MSLASAAGTGAGQLAIDGLITLAVIVVYFAPTAVVVIRKADNFTGVFLFNICLGWTVVGWVVALVLAFAGKPPPEFPPAQYGYYRPGRRQGP